MRAFFFVVGWTCLALVPCAPAVAAEKPNIVIMVADDLGWGDVGYHRSGIRSPNIDKLARESVELDRFYVFPVCSPTRAALLTGRSPLRMGITGPLAPHDAGLPMDEHLLPQAFRVAGYQTFMSGKWHLGGQADEQLPHHRGFDHFYGHLCGFIDYFRHTEAKSGRPDWQRNGKPVDEDGYSTDLLAEEAIRLVANRDKDKPFLLYLAFNAPHLPHQAPEAFVKKYRHIESPQRRAYAAVVDAMDAAIGRVLQAIDQQGLCGDTIVLFFSDNGGASRMGAASNRPLTGGKGSVFEGGIRVPAMIRWPGKIEPGKSELVMSAMDVFPTLAAAAGIETGATKPLDGRDLWPMLRDRKTVPPENLVIGSGRYLAVIDGKWKWIEIAGRPENRESHLIDILADPSEKIDLSGQHPDVARRLSRLLTPWRQTIRGDRQNQPQRGSRRVGREGRRGGW